MGETTDSVSGQAWLTFDDESLFVFVSVTDDVRGTIIPIDDNKRQRRTDSVEIYVDPRGEAAHTPQTFIAGIMPSLGSMTGPVGAGRDRDNHQGVAEETAPGMEVAVSMAETAEEYTGYDLEVKIPFARDPNRSRRSCPRPPRCRSILLSRYCRAPRTESRSEGRVPPTTRWRSPRSRGRRTGSRRSSGPQPRALRRS